MQVELGRAWFTGSSVGTAGSKMYLNSLLLLPLIQGKKSVSGLCFLQVQRLEEVLLSSGAEKDFTKPKCPLFLAIPFLLAKLL